MFQTFFYSKSTQRGIGHSKGTWALGHSRHLGTWGLGYSGTLALRYPRHFI